MTRDDIIAMARTAGYHANVLPITEVFARFAALVAAKEREACAQVCDAEFWHASKRDGSAAGVAAGNCAAAIRSRSAGGTT